MATRSVAVGCMTGSQDSHKQGAYAIKMRISMKWRKVYNFIQPMTSLFEIHFLCNSNLRNILLNHERITLRGKETLPDNSA